MSYDLVIFDCDGTLVDTEYLNLLATTQVLAEEGLEQFDLAYGYKHFLGYKFQDSLDRIAADTGYAFPPDMSRRYIEKVQALAPLHFKPVEGALELVRFVRERGVQICVASNGEKKNVLTSVKMAELDTLFPAGSVFAASDVEIPKPAPDLFLHAAHKTGVAPDRCLVIEDSRVGVQAGKAAGMTVWGFTGTHADEDHGHALRAAGADQIFDRLIHMTGALQI